MNAKLSPFVAVSIAIGIAATVTGCHTPAAKSSSTPCMVVLSRFTAGDVPAMGPDETFSPAGKWTNGITPSNLPGKGLAQHPMLYVGENHDKMFIINDGKVIWTYSTGTSYEYDDVWMLSNGNILFSRMEYVAEITPDKKVVWRYDCTKAPCWPTVTPSSLRAATATAKGRSSLKSPRTKRSSGCCKIGKPSAAPPPCKSWTTQASPKSPGNRNTDRPSRHTWRPFNSPDYE